MVIWMQKGADSIVALSPIPRKGMSGSLSSSLSFLFVAVRLFNRVIGAWRGHTGHWWTQSHFWQDILIWSLTVIWLKIPKWAKHNLISCFLYVHVLRFLCNGYRAKCNNGICILSHSNDHGVINIAATVTSKVSKFAGENTGSILSDYFDLKSNN